MAERNHEEAVIEAAYRNADREARPERERQERIDAAARAALTGLLADETASCEYNDSFPPSIEEMATQAYRYAYAMEDVRARRISKEGKRNG